MSPDRLIANVAIVLQRLTDSCILTQGPIWRGFGIK